MPEFYMMAQGFKPRVTYQITDPRGSLNQLFDNQLFERYAIYYSYLRVFAGLIRAALIDW